MTLVKLPNVVLSLLWATEAKTAKGSSKLQPETPSDVNPHNASSQTSPGSGRLNGAKDQRPPYINDSLLAELKQIDASDKEALHASLHRIKEVKSDRINNLQYDSKICLKNQCCPFENERKEISERESATQAEIQRIRKEWTLDMFLPLIPKLSDRSGQPVPEWKRQMLAVKRQEEALKAEEERLRNELEEYKRAKGA